MYFCNILLRYSNFINFPVHLNGTRINTIDAIWTKDKSAISDDDHVKFFQVWGAFKLCSALPLMIPSVHRRHQRPPRRTPPLHC